ncbi:MAG: alpha/beta hydrolase [Leptolyngbyaceae cyanobacterium]
MLSGGVLVLGALPSRAVERITIELGPAHVSVYVSDLETFAQTGRVPARLERYQSVMTARLQQTLLRHLSVEPSVRDRFIDDLIGTQKGKPFITALSQVAPQLTPGMIQTALQTAEQSDAGVTFITLLQALPGESLTLEGGALMRLAAQVGVSRLEQTALSRVLDQELQESPRRSLTQDLNPAMSGHRRPERWSVSFRDHHRDRVIPMDLYWSERNAGPTVILSHGFGADRYFLDYLAQHLASHGLTVIALEHPGSNVEALIAPEGAILPGHEFVERPRDISFILDRLSELNETSFFLRDRLELDAVTIVGHSLGGYTGLVLAGGKVDPVALADFCAGIEVGASSPADWFQCAATEAELPPESLADPRIAQLVLMNPLAGHIFGETGLRSVKVPTLVVTSTSDGIASVSDQQLRPFNQLTGPRSLIAIIGGTHLSVGDPQNINPALTQVPFMPEHPATETGPLRSYLNGTVLSFVMQQTAQAADYQTFLSPEYAALFSTSALPLRFSDRLPPRVNRWLNNRDRLTGRLTPTIRALASLLHLELIEVQYRLAHLRRDAVAQMPIRPIDVAHRLAPRAVMPADVARRSPTRESDHPAKSPPSAPRSAD